MKNGKSHLRNEFLLKRKKKYLSSKNFNFNLIFKLIKKHFKNKKITIAGYYPSNYEVNILNFLKKATKNKYKIVLPVLSSNISMSFKSWVSNQPLYVNKFGMLEPRNTKENIIPFLVMVPLVAFDNQLNRIGYGKGFYDRSLKKIKKVKNQTLFLGIAYSFQKCKNIPINKHDFKLDYIFTERGIINSN